MRDWPRQLELMVLSDLDGLTMSAAIDRLTQLLAQNPPETRVSMRIKNDSYDGERLIVTRPETEEEMRARAAAQKTRDEQRAQNVEAQERETYRRLREKYGDA